MQKYIKFAVAIMICLLLTACTSDQKDSGSSKAGQTNKTASADQATQDQTAAPKTQPPTTAQPTTAKPTKAQATTAQPTTAKPQPTRPMDGGMNDGAGGNMMRRPEIVSTDEKVITSSSYHNSTFGITVPIPKEWINNVIVAENQHDDGSTTLMFYEKSNRERCKEIEDDSSVRNGIGRMFIIRLDDANRDKPDEGYKPLGRVVINGETRMLVMEEDAESQPYTEEPYLGNYDKIAQKSFAVVKTTIPDSSINYQPLENFRDFDLSNNR